MIKITFNSKLDERHKDIAVQIPELGIDAYVDSYYLAIDNFFMPSDESATKISNCLRHMIDCWLDSCELATVGDVLYFAYDFSDQYIGLLKAYLENPATIVLSGGYTTAFLGCDTSPYEMPLLSLKEDEFEVVTNEFKMEREAFIIQLKNILEIQ